MGLAALIGLLAIYFPYVLRISEINYSIVTGIKPDSNQSALACGVGIHKPEAI